MLESWCRKLLSDEFTCAIAAVGCLHSKHPARDLMASRRNVGMVVPYRALLEKHFPNAKIVADRFHVIRLINHHFLGCWREIDPVRSKHRGLLSLMRRHRHNLKAEQQTRLEGYFDQFPVLREIYRFKQRLCYLLLKISQQVK